MQGWDESCRGRVGHAGGGSYRGGVGQAGMGCGWSYQGGVGLELQGTESRNATGITSDRTIMGLQVIESLTPKY